MHVHQPETRSLHGERPAKTRRDGSSTKRQLAKGASIALLIAGLGAVAYSGWSSTSAVAPATSSLEATVPAQFVIPESEDVDDSDATYVPPFELLDTNGDGVISNEEYLRYLAGLRDEAIQRVMASRLPTATKTRYVSRLRSNYDKEAGCVTRLANRDRQANGNVKEERFALFHSMITEFCTVEDVTIPEEYRPTLAPLPDDREDYSPPDALTIPPTAPATNAPAPQPTSGPYTPAQPTAQPSPVTQAPVPPQPSSAVPLTSPPVVPAPVVTTAPVASPIDSCKDNLISLRSDSGLFMARCEGCARVTNGNLVNSVTIHVPDPTGQLYAQWIVERIDANRVALKVRDVGTYLARCNGCLVGGAYPDSAFLHVRDWREGPWAQWTVETLANGKVAFKSDTGRYLARCNGCAPGGPPDRAFVHSASSADPWAQWDVGCINGPASAPVPTLPAPTPPPVVPAPVVTTAPVASPIDSCKDNLISLRSDSGLFMARCEGCARVTNGNLVNSVTIHVPDPTGQLYAQWIVERIDANRVALKVRDVGTYLARCNGCLVGGAYPDSAFLHVRDWREGPWAQWTVETLANGKVAFKSDTGRYLARCNGCAPGGPPDRAFVHSASSADPWAQWDVGCINGPASAPVPTLPAPTPPPVVPAPVVTTAPVASPIDSCKDNLISLRSDSGLFMARCEGCARVTNGNLVNSVTIHVPDPTGQLYAQWIVERIDANRVALKVRDVGTYLARCNGCLVGGAYPDSAFLHVRDWREGPWAQWTVETLANGKVAFKSDTGRYLARCNGCAPGGPPDRAFVHSASSADPWAQWDVGCINGPASAPVPTLPAPTPPPVVPAPVVTTAPVASPIDSCKDNLISLRSDSGLFMARCEGCARVTNGNLVNSVTIHVPDPTGQLYAQWIVERIDANRVALKVRDVGTYLARCNGCLVGGAYPDSAFLHVRDWREGPWAQWTVETLANGKVAFKSDTGRYLARCNGCAPGGPPNRAFVHSASSADPWAQWDVGCINGPASAPVPTLPAPTPPPVVPAPVVTTAPVASPIDSCKDNLISLRSDSGLFMARCEGCARVTNGNLVNSVTIHVPDPTGQLYAQWIVERIDANRVALKVRDVGTYLARCNGCLVGGAYPDSAFLHVRDWREGPWAQWTVETLANGKVAFKSDTGRYLARCNGCAPGGPPDRAFVHSASSADPWAQWDVGCINGPASAPVPTLPAPTPPPVVPAPVVTTAPVASPIDSCKDNLISLRSDSGLFMARCEGCARVTNGNLVNSVTIHVPDPTGQLYAQWIVERIDANRVALKVRDVGTYLARCNGCLVGGAYPDSAFLHVRDWREGPWAQWTVETLANGKVAFKSDTGRYLARCNGCAPGGPPDRAFVHSASSADPWAQWDVGCINGPASAPVPTLPAPTPPPVVPAPVVTTAPVASPIDSCKDNLISLRSDSGLFMARCEGCARVTNGNLVNSVTIHVPDPTGQLYAQWIVERIDANRVALKVRDVGTYLARCNGCLVGGAYPDSAFLHVRDWREGPWAQWTVETLANGKVAFKSDTGRYLARCNGCAPGGPPDRAFVHSASSADPWAQWDVGCINGPASAPVPTLPAPTPPPVVPAPVVTTAPVASPIDSCKDNLISLRSDSGLFMARCEGCARVTNGNLVNSVTIHVPDPTGQLYAQWIVERIDANRVALKVRDVGTYLARCNGCLVGGAYPDSAFLHVRDWREGPWAQWTVETLANGKVAFKSDTGRYLARCNGCAPGGPPDRAFVHSASSADPWAQWDVGCINGPASAPVPTLPAPTPPPVVPAPVVTTAPVASPIDSCKDNLISLRSDSGLFMARCEGCARVTNGNLVNSVTIHVPDPTGQLYAQWIVERIDANRVALKVRDVGTYLARCNGCLVGGAYPDSAFLHVRDWREGPWAQWTVETLANGKVAFKSDTGRYLARCNGCAPGGPPDRAFVHSASSADPWAQWDVGCINGPASAPVPTLPAPTPPPVVPAPVVTTAPVASPIDSCKDNLISLRSDSGLFMARCEGCARVTNGNLVNSVTIHVPDPTGQLYAQWIVERIDANRVALKVRDVGTYLARCNGCLVGGAYPDSAFLHVRDWREGPWAQWTVETLANGKVAFKSDTGRYLARCNGCAPGGPPDRAFVHSASSADPWAQWDVGCINGPASAPVPTLPAPTPPPVVPAPVVTTAPVASPIDSCKDNLISLRSDSGLFMARCEGCARVTNGNLVNSVTIHVPDPTGQLYAQWIVERIDANRVALKVRDVGTYLARCNGCLVGGAYPDSAFLHVRDWREGPWAQWTVETLANGKVAFKSDTGRYLARCNGCAPGGPPNRAFVHSASSADPWAQWDVGCINGPSNSVAPKDDGWKQLDGALVQVSYDGRQLCGVNSGDDIWCASENIRGDGPTRWRQVPGKLIYVEVYGDVLWGVNRAQQIWVGSSLGDPQWRQLPGSLKQITSDNKQVCGVNANDDIWCANSAIRTNPNWRQVPGKLSFVKLVNGRLVGTNSNGDIFTGRSSGDPAWKQLGGKLRQVTFDGGRLCGTNSNNDVWCADSGLSASPNWSPVPGKRRFVVSNSGEMYSVNDQGGIFYRQM
ncbi:hypothetical protein PINS_up008767 [Pythium insidiosum]|nr:hypothetical protein PINS_up008767 [Pythium insidiosum]